MRILFLLAVLVCPKAFAQKQPQETNANPILIDQASLLSAHYKIKRGHYGLVDSFLVQHQNHLVFEKYYREGHKSKPHFLASAGKSLLSALVGISLKQSQLKSIDDPVYSYFQSHFDSYQHWNEYKPQLQLKHLLTMTSGWDCLITDPKKRCGMEMHQDRNIGEAVKWLLDRPMTFEPGQRMQYTDANTSLLSILVNMAGGYQAVNYQQHLFDPMGIQQKMPSHLTSRQLVKFGQLYLNLGKMNGVQIVPEEWIKLSTQAHIKFKKSDMRVSVGYGYLWWIAQFTLPRGSSVVGYYAGGNGGQYVVVVPSMDLVVVFTGSNYNDLPTMRKQLTIVSDYVIPAIIGN